VEWEYQSITHECRRDGESGWRKIDQAHVRELNVLGAEGWEVVAAVPVIYEGETWAVSYLLKRPASTKGSMSRI
jgi:hypothetical protein